ncbi:MAG: multidrug efflux pump subunit AcrA (membrane-fusion protein) [Gammaproteobacteria bacterium]|jgi:multidrug efflux pump subunit AcrA (membrane-fusion protein)
MVKRLLPIILLLAGIAAAAVLVISRPKPPAIDVQEKVWIVSVMSAQPQSIKPTLTLYARVQSPRSATLRAAIVADIDAVLVHDGDNAAHGEVLINLDPHDARLQLAQREADAQELRAELDIEQLRVDTDRAALKHETELAALAQRAVERAKKLAKSDLGSAAGLDQASQDSARQRMNVDNRRFAIAGHASRSMALKSRLARAEAQLTMAQRDLQRTQVRAPFKARVASVWVAVGDRVRAGDALVDVFDPSALELRAQVPDRYLGALRASLRQERPATATATVGDALVRARLDRLGARIDSNRAGTDALFIIDADGASSIELGRTLQLLVALPAVTDVVPIPSEALYGNDQVYLLQDSRMRAITVQRIGEHVAADGSRRLLVKNDRLDSDSQIIITQLPSAVDGHKVSAVQ